MEQKYSKNVQKHLVKCPHCGKEVLDHMTECYYCKGRLEPKGYTPMIDEKVKKRIKTVLWIVLSVAAILIIIWKLM